MDLFYKIAEHFSNHWREYATAGAITGFFLLTAFAGNYDGREIEDKPKTNKRNLERLIRFPKP
jgi:hypothetical protein